MKSEMAALAGCIALVIGVVSAVWVFKSTMESRTYNRLTGAKTTWWDAMWVELRVMEPTR